MDQDTKQHNNEVEEAVDATEDTTPNTLKGESQHTGSGPLFGIIIIIIVLIAGGLYLWFAEVEETNSENEQLPTIQPSDGTDAVVDQLESQSVSDEIDAIEEDLSATDLDNIDAELDDILNEL